MRPAALVAPAILVLGLGGCHAQPTADGAAPNAAEPATKPAAQTAAAERTSPVSGLPIVPLEIRSGGQVHRFDVEVARTEQEQAYGLMNRQTLGPGEGMVFPFPKPRPASFWMKNTLIPLDMLFVRADGTIARIATARPLSLDPVQVGEPVAAVLEIPGGRAAELGIGTDARVSWPGGPTP
ncbi:DUF192 domain-containing protein [Sphingomonas parva]|uniref:DUF192 domain-containing protein n=1 Tax=Sphingomonas parva TaxID=2555898 RepID=A0A4Y8ZRI1_9SPHN|nr:DUF192 domain-containing protein [Sphingomonas parva]TFI58534.1 DUF192 domain-containing protein [Sphingomonas parva]